MILNQQKAYALPQSVLQIYVRSLKRHLHLGKSDFNICFVDDAAMRRMNAAFRRQDCATDVLSFPWIEHAGPGSAWSTLRSGTSALPRAHAKGVAKRDLQGFLGDIIISVETARRNARDEGHSTRNEIRWLILHGVLHLLGYDHARDNGEMTALELALRERLGVAGGRLRRSSS
jgi:probable rRNA maturation factor